jgi:hypothetical protein
VRFNIYNRTECLDALRSAKIPNSGAAGASYYLTEIAFRCKGLPSPLLRWPDPSKCENLALSIYWVPTGSGSKA